MGRKFQILSIVLFLFFSCVNIVKADENSGYYFGEIVISNLDPRIVLSVSNDVWMQLYFSSLFSRSGVEAAIIKNGEEISPALILPIAGNRLRSSTSSKGISICSCYFSGFGTGEWEQKFPVDVEISLGIPGSGQFIHPPKPEADDIQAGDVHAEGVSRFDSEPQELIITILGPNF